jgi:FkbM family methyltransferase
MSAVSQRTLVLRRKFDRAIEVLRSEGCYTLLVFSLERVIERTRYCLQALRGLGITAMGNRVHVGGLDIDVSDAGTAWLKAHIASGHYERPERELSEKYLSAEMPVIELGGCLGVVSCFINRRLCDKKRHVVVEANPALLRSIARNRELTDGDFDILHSALAYDEDHVRFFVNSDIVWSNALRGSGTEVVVPATSLQAIADQKGFDAINLVCDIEGSEYLLMDREGAFLTKRVLWFIVELHSSSDTPCALATADEKMLKLGFERIDSDMNVRVYRNEMLSGQADAVPNVSSAAGFTPSSIAAYVRR